MKLVKLAAVLIFTLSVIACGGNGSDGDSGSGGSGGGSNAALLTGSWDLTEIQGGPDEGPVPAGTASVVLTDTTFSVTEPDCTLSGTYTATSTELTTTTTNVTGIDCGFVGEVSAMAYTVNATTLILTEPGDDETMIFDKQ